MFAVNAELVWLERETVWLTQAQMAESFETSAHNISLHLPNVYRNGELDEAATTDEELLRIIGNGMIARSLDTVLIPR